MCAIQRNKPFQGSLRRRKRIAIIGNVDRVRGLLLEARRGVFANQPGFDSFPLSVRGSGRWAGLLDAKKVIENQ